MDLNGPNISPLHPPPIASENLTIDEPQYLRKVAIEDHKKIPLQYTYTIWITLKSNWISIKGMSTQWMHWLIPTN